MAPWHSFLYLLPQIWRVLARKPETVEYPFGPMELAAGFRGHVTIDSENCRGCSLCVRDCPADALELEKKGRKEYRLIYHPDRCAYCGQCELSCAFDAIHLGNDFVRGTTQRDTFITTLVDRKEEKEEEDKA